MPAEHLQASRVESRESTNQQSLADHAPAPSQKSAERLREIGGPKGLEPTRYGDWERAGRCIDF
jgi:shikimate dehydrogenase